MKKELRDQQNEDEAEETKDREKEEISVSTREFDIICEFIIPVKEQCIQLLGKIVGTLLFLVIAVTMLLWKRSSDYASVDQLVMFVFVFLMPKVVEYCCKDPNESQKSDLKSKVMDLLCRFENGDFVKFDTEEFDKTNPVVCLWKSLCTKTRTNERKIQRQTKAVVCKVYLVETYILLFFKIVIGVYMYKKKRQTEKRVPPTLCVPVFKNLVDISGKLRF